MRLRTATYIVFDTGTPNPPDTRMRVPRIRIQMTNSVSMDKSVSVSMVSVPVTTGLDHLFSSKKVLNIIIIVLLKPVRFYFLKFSPFLFIYLLICSSLLTSPQQHCPGYITYHHIVLRISNQQPLAEQRRRRVLAPWQDKSWKVKTSPNNSLFGATVSFFFFLRFFDH